MKRRKLERRQFFWIVAGATAWPAAAHGQQSGARLTRLAYLGAQSASIIDPLSIAALKQGLVENDLIEGRNVEIEYFWGDGDPKRVEELASALVKRNFDVVVTAGSQPLRSLIATGTKTPL